MSCFLSLILLLCILTIKNGNIIGVFDDSFFIVLNALEKLILCSDFRSEERIFDFILNGILNNFVSEICLIFLVDTEMEQLGD